MRLIETHSPLPADALAFDNTVDVLERRDEIAAARAVVLHFPKWTDGRAYSQAVLLRLRLRYAGELIATGEVVGDMLPMLQRCGFDAAQLRADQDPAVALRTLGRFPGQYQGDVTGARATPIVHAA
ncbi:MULTISPECIES: DUF934 domain-containing protein [unclassified Rubrivivax]|uniref:DUF934 domain-containing protein n=2 Tax=Sphaerotilaceae TaxID=2975441 RepID=A0ABX0HW54_9BURK|nr:MULTISPECIES: DUF934 domain-containing protein [unclassified Rubrivivax]MCD0416692.1 DUF934 domain-containing protein [Rubrivivax sp. JA1024]NHK98536.1 DUF934 domain-containing protein [Rubrivivax benzoatilyticus]NHL23689.1 DUF934 domain-containing protein [Rubrivivax benzoatilyticus]